MPFRRLSPPKLSLIPTAMAGWRCDVVTDVGNEASAGGRECFPQDAQRATSARHYPRPRTWETDRRLAANQAGHRAEHAPCRGASGYIEAATHRCARTDLVGFRSPGAGFDYRRLAQNPCRLWGMEVHPKGSIPGSDDMFSLFYPTGMGLQFDPGRHPDFSTAMPQPAPCSKSFLDAATRGRRARRAQAGGSARPVSRGHPPAQNGALT